DEAYRRKLRVRGRRLVHPEPPPYNRARPVRWPLLCTLSKPSRTEPRRIDGAFLSLGGHLARSSSAALCRSRVPLGRSSAKSWCHNRALSPFLLASSASRASCAAAHTW